MDNIRILKNTINDRDFFKLRKSETNDNKRIYDLETFNLKKYNNENYNYFFSKSNNNYKILESNINGENIVNTENKNYYNANENKKLDSIFSNDIEAENNIGKYKEKIQNRSHIVEENYKKFNEYQNSKFKRLNLRYTNENYNEIFPYNNDINFPPNNNNDYYMKENSSNNNINYLDNHNKSHINNSRVGNRIYKSFSTGNIFQNNYYLSNFEPTKNQINLHNNKYMGKKRTDITNDELINMRENNENGYYDYCNKKLELLLDNKKIVENKLNQEKINKYNSRMQEQNEIKIRNKYFNNLKAQNILELKKSKLKYKNFLDVQIKNNINNKLFNENLTLRDIIQNKYYLLKKSNIPNRNFLNKNGFVEINPYNHRKYYLGNSSLKNNVLLNPQVQYKTNRYIFPQISSKK